MSGKSRVAKTAPPHAEQWDGEEKGRCEVETGDFCGKFYVTTDIQPERGPCQWITSPGLGRKRFPVLTSFDAGWARHWDQGWSLTRTAKLFFQLLIGLSSPLLSASNSCLTFHSTHEGFLSKLTHTCMHIHAYTYMHTQHHCLLCGKCMPWKHSTESLTLTPTHFLLRRSGFHLTNENIRILRAWAPLPTVPKL